MASLTAPAIVEIGGMYDFIVPLMAAHLFCFYFGILADDTPPVGLAAYAAAAIAKSDPIATGIQGFMYDIRTAILPFMFIFNSDLILHNITSWPAGLLIFAMACMGNFAFRLGHSRVDGGEEQVLRITPAVGCHLHFVAAGCDCQLAWSCP